MSRSVFLFFIIITKSLISLINTCFKWSSICCKTIHLENTKKTQLYIGHSLQLMVAITVFHCLFRQLIQPTSYLTIINFSFVKFIDQLVLYVVFLISNSLKGNAVGDFFFFLLSGVIPFNNELTLKYKSELIVSKDVDTYLNLINPQIPLDRFIKYVSIHSKVFSASENVKECSMLLKGLNLLPHI